MRLLLALLLVVLLPGLAEPQRRRPPEPDPPASTLPPIGLPLPQIGLPLPPIGLAPPSTPTTSENAPAPRSRSPRPAQRRGRSGPSVVYVVPAYPWAVAGAVAPGAPAADRVEAVSSPPSTSTLALDVEPRGIAEIYVDGYFVGTADDRRGDVSLSPGPHRVELRAGGYQPETVDVRGDAGSVVTLRRTLKPVDALPAQTSKPAAASAPIPRKPFYFIPGCYLGDVPPKDAGLPASCDQSKTVVVKP